MKNTQCIKRRADGLAKLLFVTIGLLSIVPSLRAQSLMDLISLAQTNNSKIQAYELRFSVANEKVTEAGSLPDTELGAGIFASEPETRTGAQKARFSIRQMLPWFGTITAREHYAASMAETEYEELSLLRRQLVLDISMQYYRLYAIRATTNVLQENISLLATYEKQALTLVEVGKASVVDILKLQIRQNELRERSQVLEQEFTGIQADLNRMLNRDVATRITILDSLYIPEEEPAVSKENILMHPELVKYEKLYQSVVTAELLNRKEAAADFGLGLDYIPVQERGGMDFVDNGKDILMPMITLSVPLFNKSYNSRSRQNQMKQQELQAMKQDRENYLRSQLADAIAMREAARIRYGIQEDNLKKTGSAEEILIRNYETGTIDFNDVLDIQELRLRFQGKRIDAITDYFLQSSMVNYIRSNDV